jgi:plastocyanin
VAERGRGVSRCVGAIAAVSLLTLTAACNSGTSASVAPTPDVKPTTAHPRKPSGPPTATIKNNKVSPASLDVGGGATVTIHNNDSVGHRLDNQAEHLYSGTIPAKSKGEITAPPKAGTYVFKDPNHPSTQLRLKVH